MKKLQNWTPSNICYQFNVLLNHSHKKQKDNLETLAVLLIFSLELEISEVAVQDIHRNSEKW